MNQSSRILFFGLQKPRRAVESDMKNVNSFSPFRIIVSKC